MNSPVGTEADALAARARSGWQWPYFYLTIAGGALAYSVYGQSGDFWDAVTSFAVVWVTAGLAIQVADISLALRNAKTLSCGQCAAWCFDAFWRAALAVTLPTYYLLRDPEQILTAADGAPHAPLAARLQFVLFAISLIAALSSNGRYSVATARRNWRKVGGEVVLWASVAGLAFLLAWQAILPDSFERVVTSVLDVLEPADALGNDETLALRQSQFVAHAMAAGSAGLLAILLARWFGKSRQITGQRAVIFVCLTFAMMGLAANSLYWLVSQGGSLATNAFADAEQSWFSGIWRGMSCLLIFITTALAWRFTVSTADSASTTAVGWRTHPQHYYHESRWGAALLFVASVGQMWASVSYLFGYFRTRATDWSMVAEPSGLVLTECVTQPAFVLLTTISLVALRGVIGRRGAESSANQATIRSLPERRFAVVWVTLLVALAVETAALAWLGFALWHSSWQAPLPIDA